MRNAAKYIALSALVVMMLFCTACRRTKTCRCEGNLNGKPEVLYFEVEHRFHCKDLNRTGFERQQDTLFIRTMHNLTCVEQEYTSILYEADRENKKDSQESGYVD